MDNTAPHDLILWFFLTLFIGSIALLGWLFRPFMSTLVMAAVLTGMATPVYHWLEPHLRAASASFVTCILIFILLFIPLILFVGVLAKESLDFIQMAKSMVLIEQIEKLFHQSSALERVNAVLEGVNLHISAADLYGTLSQISKSVGLFLFNQTQVIAGNVFRFLINFFFMLLVIYFLLIDSPKLIAFIKDLSPLPEEQDQKLIQKFKDMAGAILVGNGICGLIQGLAGGLMFALFGIKSAFLWGVIMAILAFLPVVGIGIVFLPAAIYLFLVGRIGAGLFFIVFYFLLMTGIEYLLKPKLVGGRVKMHTLLVFLSIMGGLNLFGILGIIYGPLIVTGFLTLTDIYHSSYQQLIENDIKT